MLDGIISMLGRERRERICRRRGEEEARMKRFERRWVRIGRESGGGRGSREARFWWLGWLVVLVLVLLLV